MDCKHQVDQHEKENGNGHNQIDSSGSGSSTMQSDTPKAKKRVTLAPIIPVTRDHQQILIRRRHISVSRERRAAFVLAIVVVVFIIHHVSCAFPAVFGPFSLVAKLTPNEIVVDAMAPLPTDKAAIAQIGNGEMTKDR